MLKTLVEIVGWVSIAMSPTLVGLLAGLWIYRVYTGTVGLVVGGIMALMGMVLGIFWANSIWKKGDTINFLSRIMVTPALDKPHQQQENENEQSVNP